MASATVKPNTNTSYTFTSSPRALSGRNSRSKYREPSESEESPNKKRLTNLMVDPRVRRGSNVPAPTSQIQIQKEEEERQKSQSKSRNSRQKTSYQTQHRPLTPDAVPGRKHTEIQTEVYLEEITDRKQEKEIETQTDPFMERPPTPKFIPTKTGIDVSSQIWPGELFDFDLEVEPLLSVLISKTLEQSMMEVREEEELANMKTHQEAFAAKRAAELAETQKMEELERRREVEKAERIQQEKERLRKESKIREKLAAKAFAQQYLQELTPTVFENLTEKGFFYDPVHREIETVFVPWLLQNANNSIQQIQNARKIVDGLLQAALFKGLELHKIEKEQQLIAAEQARLHEEENQNKHNIKTSPTEGINESALGVGVSKSESEDDGYEYEDEEYEDDDEEIH